MHAFPNLLWPKPQRLSVPGGELVFSLPAVISLEGDAAALYSAGSRLALALRGRGVETSLVAAAAGGPGIQLKLRVAAEAAPHAQGYRLDIDSDGIDLAGSDPAGLAYGVTTLIQVIDLQAPALPLRLPLAAIEDWPDFPQRGVMLDVARDRVPTMATMYALVDMLASLKMNELQLYMEHTFAYAGHEVVWKDASPFTGEEILNLDAYCRERFVELVPNQNSFGHMHRWLIHEPYRQLAECPDGIELWPGSTREPFSLCPGDPGSIELLANLYDQLLPHFSSGQFNVGCDETFDLGRCRSAEVCKELGTERVYLDFLKRVHGLVRERGRRMQFWGDIILHRPELIPELPADAIALEWGYEATHPFEEHAALFARAGLDFYVCPGTSSWNTIAGRTDNALGNIQSAARHGHAAGAIGLLNTDWGDSGHMQPLPASYVGYVAGAGAGWNSATDLAESDIPAVLDRHVFHDEVGVMGRIAYDLGNVYRLCGTEPGNSSALFLLLVHPGQSLRSSHLAGLSREGLEATLHAIDTLLARVPQAAMACPDADLVKEELAWAGDILRWSAALALARVEAGAIEGLDPLPAAVKLSFAEGLERLTAQHRSLWLRRSRPGGLRESAARLEQVVKLLRG